MWVTIKNAVRDIPSSISFSALLMPAIRRTSEKEDALKDGMPSPYLFILMRPVVHSHWSPLFPESDSSLAKGMRSLVFMQTQKWVFVVVECLKKQGLCQPSPLLGDFTKKVGFSPGVPADQSPPLPFSSQLPGTHRHSALLGSYWHLISCL